MPTKQVLTTPAVRRKEIIAFTDQFCTELLNDEYRDMCRVMAKNLCIKGSPALKGEARPWAAAVVAAIGLVNFLDDPSFQPFYTRKDLAKRLGYSYSTLKKYTDNLVEGFDLSPFDLDFTLPSLMHLNPLVTMLGSPSVLLNQCCGGQETSECCDEAECCQVQKPKRTKRKS